MAELTDKEQEKFDDELIQASFQGDVLKMKRLIAKGADINSCYHNGEKGKPLKFACYSGSLIAIKSLVDNGADVNCEPSPFETLFDSSLSFEEVREIADYLIENGADLKLVKKKDFILNYPLEYIRYLADKGLKLSQTNKYDLALEACCNGDFDMIQYLLNKGLKVTSNNNNIIALASRENNLEIVKYLHQNGGDIDIAIK